MRSLAADFILLLGTAGFILLLGASPFAAPVPMLPVAAGRFVVGSGPEERSWAYEHSPAWVRTQGWYDAWELAPRGVTLARFSLDARPVTQGEYAAFVAATGRRAPGISRTEYQTQGFLAHPYTEVRPYLWVDDAPPGDRLDHPVVLVDREDARAYCAWQGKRLPTEFEWEVACRGPHGWRFPWGDSWDPGRVHIQATGTAAVAASRTPADPSRSLEMLGNVFEWTSSEFGAGRAALKGCSWDDSVGSCRCAFRHGRPATSRHILIGFRCARDG